MEKDGTLTVTQFAIIQDPANYYRERKEKVDRFYSAGEAIHDSWVKLLSAEIEDNLDEGLFVIPMEGRISRKEEDRDRWLKDQYFDAAMLFVSLNVYYVQYIYKHGWQSPRGSIKFYIQTKTYGSYELNALNPNDEKLSFDNLFFAYKEDYEKVKNYVLEIVKLMGLKD